MYQFIRTFEKKNWKNDKNVNNAKRMEIINI